MFVVSYETKTYGVVAEAGVVPISGHCAMESVHHYLRFTTRNYTTESSLIYDRPDYLF